MNGEAATTRAEPLQGRLVRGALGGVVAGLVFAFVTMWFADSMPMGAPGDPLRLISTVVEGKSALMSGAADVGTGWAVHLAISAIYGMVFALAVPWLRTTGLLGVAGGVYGAALFVVNFLVIAEVWLDQFQMPNKPFELAIHLVFGFLLAAAFAEFGARRLQTQSTASSDAERSPAVWSES